MNKALLFVLGNGLLSFSICSDLQKPTSANVSGAPTAKTGSPGDGGNCTMCHSGTAATVAGLITSNIPPQGYMPGNTYTITGTVTEPGRVRFGFEISPQSPTGALMGSMTITNSTETKLIGAGKWVTHQSAGTSGTGTRSWSFNWTAPPINSGTVTFYGAFNSANNNTLSSGDIIRLSTLVVPQDPSAGLFNPESLQLKAGIFPNPVSDQLNLEVELPADGLELAIFNLQGQQVYGMFHSDFVRGTNRTTVPVSTLESGVYFLNLNNGSECKTLKFVKQ